MTEGFSCVIPMLEFHGKSRMQKQEPKLGREKTWAKYRLTAIPLHHRSRGDPSRFPLTAEPDIIGHIGMCTAVLMRLQIGVIINFVHGIFQKS